MVALRVVPFTSRVKPTAKPIIDRSRVLGRNLTRQEFTRTVLLLTQATLLVERVAQDVGTSGSRHASLTAGTSSLYTRLAYRWGSSHSNHSTIV